MTSSNPGVAGRLAGKVALITGAARGQGAAAARLFVAEGARVVIGDVLVDEGRALAAELGEQASFVRHDVAAVEDWTNAVSHTVSAFGGLDVLLNNAGIYKVTPLRGTTAEEYLAVIKVNQLGVFLGMQAAVPALVRSRSEPAAASGSIINISSIAGLRGVPGLSAYVASKFAIRGMTKSAAFELAPAKIRVNSIHAGVIDTPMLAEVFPVPGMREEWAARIPIGELAEASDIAEMALFLASEASKHCTGAEFVVDGGLTAGNSWNV